MSVLIKNALQGVIDDTSQNAQALAEAFKREDDYVDPTDGFIHCGKCRQPKECMVELWKIKKPVPCKCREDQLAQEEAERKKERIEFLRKDGFSDAAMQRSIFENDDNPDGEMSAMCRNYVKNFAEYYKRGKGLLMSGSVGTGKTFYASCIANALIDQLRPCLVTSVSRYIRGMESSEFGGMNEKIDYLNRFDLIVFDDLGVERNTPYMNELVYAIIDGRVRTEKPMIVTTNIDLKSMSSAAAVEQARIYDRILSVCIPLVFNGESMRKTKAREEYREEIRKLKGGAV